VARITPVPASVLRRVFELAGFTCTRTEGDHFVYTKPGAPRPVVIPNWNPVSVFIIRNNLRTAGISREEYFRPLNQA
jgi:predicted RNA binding protein YcfA (HicA-like mRNA interferase family)